MYIIVCYLTRKYLKKENRAIEVTFAKPMSLNQDLISKLIAVSFFPRNVFLTSQSGIFWSTPISLSAI